jgi:hypothetical protein
MTREQFRTTVVESAGALGLPRLEDRSMRILELSLAIFAFGGAALLALLR